MDSGFFNGLLTALALFVFIVVVIWAFNGRRKKDFDDAANAPFALSDEAEGSGQIESAKQSMNHRNVNHDE